MSSFNKNKHKIKLTTSTNNSSLLSSVENITGITSKPNMNISSARIPLHLIHTSNNNRILSSSSTNTLNNNNNNSSTYNGVTNKPSRFVRHTNINNNNNHNNNSSKNRLIRTKALLSTAANTIAKSTLNYPSTSKLFTITKQTSTKNDYIEMISRNTSPTPPTIRIIDSNKNNIYDDDDSRKNCSRGSDYQYNEDDEEKVHKSQCSICNIERISVVRPKKYIFGIQKCHQETQTTLLNCDEEFKDSNSLNEVDDDDDDDDDDMLSCSKSYKINNTDEICSRPTGKQKQNEQSSSSSSLLLINNKNNDQNSYSHMICNKLNRNGNHFTSVPVIATQQSSKSSSSSSSLLSNRNNLTQYKNTKFGTSSTTSSPSPSPSSSSSLLSVRKNLSKNLLKNGQSNNNISSSSSSSLLSSSKSSSIINRPISLQLKNNNNNNNNNNTNETNINQESILNDKNIDNNIKNKKINSLNIHNNNNDDDDDDCSEVSVCSLNCFIPKCDCVNSDTNINNNNDNSDINQEQIPFNQKQNHSGSYDDINLLTIIKLDDNVLERSASAEPLFNNSNEKNCSSSLSSSSSTSSTSSVSSMSTKNINDYDIDDDYDDRVNMNKTFKSTINDDDNSENEDDFFKDATENYVESKDDNDDDDDDDDDEFNNTFTIRLSSAQSNRTVISCDSFSNDDNDDDDDNQIEENKKIKIDYNNDDEDDEIKIENAINSIKNEVTSLKESSSDNTLKKIVYNNDNNNNVKNEEEIINNDENNNNNNNNNNADRKINHFICKYKDIDDMIGEITPNSTSPNYFQALRKFKFENVREKFEQQQQQQDNNNNNNNKTVSINVSNVRIHCPNKPMHSTVEFLTEEIDSSVVRIRENKALSGHLSKVYDDVEKKNFIIKQSTTLNNDNNNDSMKNQQQQFHSSLINNNNNNNNLNNNQQKLSSSLSSSSSSLEDCTFQLYKFNIETNECEYGNYIDLDMNIDEQNEEFDGFLSSRKNAVILRTKLSVRVHAIIEKLLNSSGRELRRALFSLKQIFQDDKDLVHEFVRNDGLACLIKVGSEADQNYQNYILRALGQLMLYVDGMNGVIEHPETIQWLYSLISSEYRLVVKTALKLLLVFVEYIDSNCLILINSIHQIDNERGVKPWNNIMNILNEKDSADIELLIFSMTLINKTLNGIPDQDTYYDVCDALEEQGIERIIQHYMSKHGTDRDLLQQFRIYESVLRLEDGDDDGSDGMQVDSRLIPRNRKTNNNEDRRKSKRHSIDIVNKSFSIKNNQINETFNRFNNKLSTTTTTTTTNKASTVTNIATTSIATTTTTTTTTTINSSLNNKKTFYNLPPNVNPSMVSNGFDEININLKKRNFRSKSLARDHEIHNQRSSISSCSSADSYGSYASYGSYISNDDTKATTLIDPLKNLDSPSIDSNEDDTDRSLDLNSRSSNHTESSDEMLKHQDYESSQESFNLWETTKKSVLNHGYHQEVSSGLSRQPSLKERKTWMLSMMYNKTNGDDAPKSPNFLKPPAPILSASTGLWNGNAKTDIVSPSPTVINDLLNLNNQTESVKCLKEKFIQQTTQSDSNFVPKLIHTKEQMTDKFTNNFEYLQWEQLVNQMSRPLVINDMDFTDLVDDDDNDICNPTVPNVNNSNNFGPPPPPPPPMLTVNGATPPPPPPPLRFNGPGLGNWSATNNNNNNNNSIRNTNTPSPPVPPPMDSKLSSNKNKKTIKLFWKEVKEDKSLLSRIMKKKTIWDEIKHVPVDTEKLETLFESRTKELMNKKTQDANKKNEILVLDTKRSNAINIGMTKLPPPRTIKTAILKMDQSIMNREGIEKILTTMMPTEEEKNKIMEAEMNNPDVPLGQAESFLMTLSSITALEARLRLWAFRLDYEQMEREVAEPLMDLKQAIHELEKSETFKIILGTLRSIGSFLNGSDVKGFQIDYLAKVPEIKDTIHKHSLLHHLAQMIMEKFPNTSNLYSELGAVSRASKVDFDDLGKNLHKMEQDCKQSWEHLKVISKFDGSSPMKNKMSEFLADCAQRIIVLEIIHRRVMNRFKKFLVFLGMSSNAIKENKPNHLLKIISEFALEYRTTRERVREQIEKKANHRERNKTRGKMITEMDKFKSKEQAETDLERILTTNIGVSGETRVENGNVTKWGTLPGTKLRRPSTGSMTNLVMNGNVNGTKGINAYRHSVHVESYGEADDEILESLVRSTTQQPVRATEKNRRKARYGERKSLRRTLRGNLDLSEEERMMLSAITT